MKNLFIKFRLLYLLLCMALSSIFTSFCVFADENPEDWITKKPSGGIFLEGESVTLDVTLASVDGLSCQWYKDGNIISGATGTSYTINNLTLSDGAEYSVTISKNVEEEILTSSSSTIVTVVKEIQSTEIINEKEGIQLKIEANGGNPTYLWYKDKEKIGDKSICNINNATLGNAGDYGITIESNGNTRWFIITLAVIKATVSPEGELKDNILYSYVNEDGKVTMSVQTGTEATYQYQWYKDGNPITGANNETYEIKKVKESDEGTYKVKVSKGKANAISNQIQLNIDKYSEHPAGMVYKYTNPGWTRLTPDNAPNGAFVFISHGNRNSLFDADGQWVANLAAALKSKENAEVLAVDWGNFAYEGRLFGIATTPGHHIPTVAKRASYILFGTDVNDDDFKKTWNLSPFNKHIIIDNPKKEDFQPCGLKPQNAHFIGHSHGAHVCGNIAYNDNKILTVKRLTLLDCSPQYGGHTWIPIVTPKSCKWVSSATKCAEFVEFYKSSQLMSWDKPIGHINLLVGKDRTSPMTWSSENFSAEDHGFSHKWYLETIRNPKTDLKFKLGYSLKKSDDLTNELNSSINTVDWKPKDFENQFIGVVQCNGTTDYQLDVLERWFTDDKYKQWREDYKVDNYKIKYQGLYNDADDVVKRHSKMVDIYLTTTSSNQKYEKGEAIDFQITAEDYLQSSKLKGENAFTHIQEEVEIYFYLDTIKDICKDEESADGFPIYIDSQKMKLSSGISKGEMPKGSENFKISIPEIYDETIKNYFEKNPSASLYLRAEVKKIQDLTFVNEELIDVYKPNDQAAIEIENNPFLDLCLLIDSTGSMGDSISAVKSAAINIINEALGKSSNNRVSVVDYRDFPDGSHGDSGDYVSRVRTPFTSNSSSIISAINSISVDGGADWEEAAFSAIANCIKGTLGGWRKNAKRVIMLMTDAPPHEPEPYTGYTRSSITSMLKAGGDIQLEGVSAASDDEVLSGPISLWPILVGSIGTSYEGDVYYEIAESTSGKVFAVSDGSEVVDALLEIIHESTGTDGITIEDVTKGVACNPISWELDQSTGALVATFRITNNGGKDDVPLEKAFWYAIKETDTVKLMTVSGTIDGLSYTDVTKQIEAQLPSIGNKDMKLDIGESVTFTVAFYSKDRSIPQGQLYAIWADPPKAKITLPKLNAALSKDGSTVSISWESLEVESAASASYIVEESDSLTQPNWNPVSTETVKQDQKEVLVVPASNGTKFYRLRQK